MGRFALPVFRFGRLLQAKPPDIASAIAAAVTEQKSGLVTVEATGGFLNARIDSVALARENIAGILAEGNHFGEGGSRAGGLAELVEYSSVNIAKPFGIGHLRTTILGNSLRLIFQKLGYDVVGINYLGDWGTQFGKMIVAFRRWGQDLSLEEAAVEKLVKLYVRFHEEAKEDATLDDEARKAFRDLEAGEVGGGRALESFQGSFHC